MPNPDLAALKRLCKEAVEATKEALAVKTHFESVTSMRELPGVLERVHKTEIRLTIGEVLAIAACIVEMGKHLNEAYCSLYGTEDGNKLFEGLINGMNTDRQKERGCVNG